MKLNDLRAVFANKRIPVLDKTLQRYRNLTRDQVNEAIISHQRIGKALGKLIRHHPFYASIAMASEIYMDNRIPAAATNGEAIIFNTKWVADHTEAELIGVIAHEVEHIALLHPMRMRKRNHTVWNIACDYVINDQLIEQGFTLPGDVLHDKKYAGQNAEVVYEDVYKHCRIIKVPVPGTQSSQSGPGGILVPPSSGDGNPGTDDGGNGTGGQQNQDDPSQSQSQDQSGNGGSGNGSESLNTPRTPSWGAVVDGTSGLSETDKSRREERIKQNVHQAALHAQAVGCGKDAATAERIIKTYEDDTNWKDILREFIKTTSDRCDFSWNRPNKRYIQSGIYLPQMSGEKLEDVVIAIDTSGSISQSQLDRFGGALTSVLSEFEAVTLHVIYCDTTIHKAETLTKADLPLSLEGIGGGGTNFRPPFQWVEEQGIEPSCFMYFTDMQCDSFPSEEPGYDVRWINFDGEGAFNNWAGWYGRRGHDDDFPPFGEVIHMDLPEAV
jgi:predicted metal-dependent peptidase